MTVRNEHEHVLQQALRRQLSRGTIDRREFLTRSLVAGLGAAGVGALAKGGIGSARAADRPLTPTFYQWIQDLHPGIPAVNAKFPGINYQIAPVEGFGIERFVAEAKNKQSTWDVYVGQTPFVEMSALIKADVIEPWDNYIPKDVIDDIIPSIRAENTIDGKLYGWPFLLDVIGTGWHSGITAKAGVADAAPATWDDFLADGKKIVDSKAAPWGATFDAHGWRSLVPVTHSMSTKVYTPEGLFDFTSEPAIEALMLLEEDHGDGESRYLAGGRVGRRRQRDAGRGRFRGAARRSILQVLQRAAAHGGELGRSETAAPGAAAEVHERRWLDGVLDDRMRADEIRPEQGKGGRIHQGADLRPADLEGLDRRHQERPSRPAAALQVHLRRMGAPTSRTGCPISSGSCAPSSTWPRRSTTTCSA